MAEEETRNGGGWLSPSMNQAQALGRIYTISPRQGECFYLRLLLHNVNIQEAIVNNS